jgi:hypothetical protein
MIIKQKPLSIDFNADVASEIYPMGVKRMDRVYQKISDSLSILFMIHIETCQSLYFERITIAEEFDMQLLLFSIEVTTG